MCERLIEEKLPDIIEALVNGLPPQKVCEAIIGGCTTSTTTLEPEGIIYSKYCG